MEARMALYKVSRIRNGIVLNEDVVQADNAADAIHLAKKSLVNEALNADDAGDSWEAEEDFL
jgi:hypothetical protein